MVNAIYPNWPAPRNVHALTTTRQGGVSHSPYDCLNLASHVGDDLQSVIENRAIIIKQAHIPTEPVWLNQTHSTNVINIADYQSIDADASYSDQKNQVSAVMTADCLPVLFCSQQGDQVASAHAGWRGLCHGVLENTVSHFTCSPKQIIAWLGPAIGPQQFEVGEEVKAQFEAQDLAASKAFILCDEIQQKYLANLYLLARQRLNRLGITDIYGGDYCTYTQRELFYSYRRDNQTGRMASLIWFD